LDRMITLKVAKREASRTFPPGGRC
jgi:hypothetical protein